MTETTRHGLRFSPYGGTDDPRTVIAAMQTTPLQ
jgi:hypothetical protein